MPPPIAIVAFGAGLLLVLGVAYLRGRWPPPRRAPRPTERRFDAGAVPLMVGVAYVVDPSLLSDTALTFAKIRYVAIGAIERA